MARFSYAATPDNPLFIALHRVAKAKPKPARVWSPKDKNTRNRRQERRLAENREHIQQMGRRQSDEAARKFPDLYAYVRSPEFLAWYEAMTGTPWDPAIESDPDQIMIEVGSLREMIELREIAARREAAAQEVVELMMAGMGSTVDSYARRRFMVMMAMPPWADKDAIQRVYMERDRLNHLAGRIEYHVDHVIPLQGDNVCGLHVAENLRVIKARENCRKSNSF